MHILQMALAFCKAMQHFFTPLSLGNMKVSKNLSEGGWTSQNPQVNWNLLFSSDALDLTASPHLQLKGEVPWGPLPAFLPSGRAEKH